MKRCGLCWITYLSKLPDSNDRLSACLSQGKSELDLVNLKLSFQLDCWLNRLRMPLWVLRYRRGGRRWSRALPVELGLLFLEFPL